jgi:hypothetical protein
LDICTHGAWSMDRKTRSFIENIKAIRHNELGATVSFVKLLLWKHFKRTEDGATRGCKGGKFYKIKAIEFKKFQCSLWRYTMLLPHTEDAWLSRGTVLVRVFTLRSEMLLLSADQPYQVSSGLCDTVWSA